MRLSNGCLWTDTSGNPIHAHGGGMLRMGEYVYWFGENRQGRNRVACYRSKNMTEWEFRGNVLTLDSMFQPIETRTSPELVTDRDKGTGCNMERPKVVYNEATGKFVMWMHWENGKDYGAARCAVATCDTVDGDYVYHGSFNPIGHMSRDCTLFVDDDGTAYFISASRENADLHMYRLSDDYLSVDEHVRTLWPGQYREAPAVLKRDGLYFMITSGCTGWEPNQAKYAFADSLTGRWSKLFDFGGPTAWDTQPSYILPVKGTESETYLYLGDRWDPSDYHASSYVLLPLHFPTPTTMELHWADTLKVDLSTGTAETSRTPSGVFRIRSRSLRYAAPADEDSRIVLQKLSYRDESQLWRREEADSGYVRIRHRATGKYMGTQSHDEDSVVLLTDRPEEDSQHWRIVPEPSGGGCRLQHRETGKWLTWSRTSDRNGYVADVLPGEEGTAAQTFLLAEQYGARID
ncbi:family 43 glycosylhydrolase [Paenibacillus silviterrae]|uniref:family 43 glycosylhydrolase n=1 Tax=Paenibacillus silviterrae TaxID=3242194 RepID=UPI00254316CA|nr:family 43 glycosylhydrolase [Paenibacillus chinjuensis]